MGNALKHPLVKLALIGLIIAGPAGLVPSSAVGTISNDAQPPSLSDVAARRIEKRSAVIRWSTNEKATSRAEYWEGIASRRNVRSSTLVKTHAVEVSRLARGTTYSYRVLSTDAAGNTAVSTVYSFTTKGKRRPTPTPSPSPTPPPTPTLAYHVDSINGDDANSGLSESLPWRSLTKAQSAQLGSDMGLLFKRGGSWTGSLNLGASGTAEFPVVVGAYGTGSPPIIRDGGCVTVSGTYVTLRDLQIDNCTWAGVAVSGSYNRIENNLIMHNVAGVNVKAGALGNQVLRNVIKENQRMSVNDSTPTDNDSGAFGVLLNGDETVVSYNTISGHDAFSYDYGRDGGAIEIYGGRNNTIHHNEAVDNDSFAELGDPRSADNTFYDNVVRSSLAGSIGVVTRGASSGWGPVLGTRLLHNTFHLTGSSAQGFVCHGGCGPAVLTMRNNVVQATWKVGYADAPFDEDHNMFWGGQRQFQVGAHSVVTDPAFVDPAVGNLRLRPTSLGIDRGISAGIMLDFDDALNPWDGNGDGVSAPDIGAFEVH